MLNRFCSHRVFPVIRFPGDPKYRGFTIQIIKEREFDEL